ncbi:MAG: adenosylcobinamide-GDP ribazoletransferase [bacterium]
MIGNTFRKLAFAVSFLTIIPVRTGTVTDRVVSGSAAFFPLVGYLIGAVLAGVCVGMRHIAGEGAAAVVTVAVWLAVTRALHFDGMTDVFDGFWGGATSEDRLRIMKDSRMGAFGTASGIILIAGKIIFLGQISVENLLPALLVTPAVARLTVLFIGVFSTRPAGGGLGAIFVKNVRGRALIAAALLFLVPSYFILNPLYAVSLVAIGALVSLTLMWLAHRKIGGVNGDVFGATVEITEWMCLLAACVAEQWL